MSSEEVTLLIRALGLGIKPRISIEDDGAARLWDATQEELEVIRRAVRDLYPGRQVIIEVRFRVCDWKQCGWTALIT